MRLMVVMVVVSSVLLAACTAAPPRGNPVAEVMETDRAFARAARDKGIKAAFVEFAATDAILFRHGVGPIKGVSAIGAAFDGTQAATLVWEPEEAQAAASADLAYSWGYSRYSPPGGAPPVTANYVSIWRKQPDGRWKWVIDLGVVAPPKP